MIVALKNSTRTPLIYLLFHSLTCSLCFSLSFRTASLSWSSLFFVSCSLSGTHSKIGRLWLALLALCFCFSSLLSAQGRMASVFFLSFFLVSACPTRLTTLLFKISQTPSCFSHFSINEKACFEDFWNKLLTGQVGWKKRVSRAPNKMYF